jgi:Outer membrane protein beta-barrel domain
MRRVAYLGGFIMLAVMSSASSSPIDPLGIYVGAAGGRSDIRVTSPYSGLDLNAHPNGWMVFAGLRPISFVGAELEYVDFGHATVQSIEFGLPDVGPLSESVEWHQRAATLSGIVYAPIPVSLLDLYAKAGVAHLETTGTASGMGGCGFILKCPQHQGPPTVIEIRETDTRFSYGAGAQLKIPPVAIRVEYQRIGASGRDPDLLSFGLSFTF